MIVSGGKILAIDGVEHDFTLSGDGVKTPIGITEELLEKIRNVSGKLDTTYFETWSAQTEHWDVQEYSGGEGIKVENHLISVSAKYLTSGDLEPYATKAWVEDQKYLTSGDLEPYAKTQWVQEELEKKQNLSDMSAYAQSAWVDEKFQPKGDYITPKELDDALAPYATSAWVNEQLAEKVNVSAMSAYATSAWVDENFLRQADYHEYSAGNDYIRIDEYKVYGYDWTSAVSAVPFKLDTSAFEQHSAWADRTYLKQDALEHYVTSAGLDPDQQYAMTNSGWAPVDIPDETVVSGTSGISAQKIGDTWVVGTSAQYATSDWVQDELDKKQDVSDMSAYATSAWVDKNFLKQAVRVSYDAQSEELHMDFSPHPGEVEIGGRWYPYVQIGNQLWLAENLDYKWSGLTVGSSGTSSSESRANYYNNDESTYGVNGNKHGLLYNHYATDHIIEKPTGWHLPSKSEWETLIAYVGDSPSTKLRSTLFSGSDDYGMSILPTGMYTGNFSSEGTGYFWASDGPYSGSYYYINFGTSPNVSYSQYSESYEMGIRLVKTLT